MISVADPINHVLRQNIWALDRLKRLAGKTVCFRVSPFNLTIMIQQDGSVAEARSDAPNATLSATPSALLRYFASEPRDARLIEIAGDAGMAADIGSVLSQLQWEAEEDLSRVFGDIAAHRIIGIGGALLEWRKQAISSVAQSFAEYWTEEAPILAKPVPVQKFLNDVDDLRDATERLEQRIERLEQC